VSEQKDERIHRMWLHGGIAVAAVTAGLPGSQPIRMNIGSPIGASHLAVAPNPQSSIGEIRSSDVCSGSETVE
jgi:hypothetical protein